MWWQKKTKFIINNKRSKINLEAKEKTIGIFNRYKDSSKNSLKTKKALKKTYWTHWPVALEDDMDE